MVLWPGTCPASPPPPSLRHCLQVERGQARESVIVQQVSHHYQRRGKAAQFSIFSNIVISCVMIYHGVKKVISWRPTLWATTETPPCNNNHNVLHCVNIRPKCLAVRTDSRTDSYMYKWRQKACHINSRANVMILLFTRQWSTHKYIHMHCCAEGLGLQCFSLVTVQLGKVIQEVQLKEINTIVCTLYL